MDSRGGPDPHPKTRGSARFPEQNSFRIERLRPCLGPFLSEKENAVLPVPAEFLDHFRGAISAAMVHKHEGRGAGGQESFKGVNPKYAGVRYKQGLSWREDWRPCHLTKPRQDLPSPEWQRVQGRKLLENCQIRHWLLT